MSRLVQQFRDSSIQAKLNLMVVFSTGIALTLACVAFGVNEARSSKQAIIQHLSAITDVVAANSVAAVSFQNERDATEVLASFQLEPMVRYARIVDPGGETLATYIRKDWSKGSVATSVANKRGVLSHGDTLEFFVPIADSSEEVGTLYVEAGTEVLGAKFRQYALLATLILGVCLVASLLASAKLQNVIASPIAQLAVTAKEISQQRDYAVRVEKKSADEIGVLYDEFNGMLATIQSRERELHEAHQELERRVEEISHTNEELNREVEERKRAEQQLEELQEQQLVSAHLAGKAEVATSVLHNVGNVLNSINVSARLVEQELHKLGVADLVRASEIIEQHVDDLASFVTEDAQGQHLAPFLINLSHHMSERSGSVTSELQSLTSNVEHIKEIVALQQSHAVAGGLIQTVSLTEVIEDAIRVNSASTDRHHVELVRQFDCDPTVETDRHKLLQILINLISNAKYALLEHNGDQPRQIVVRLLPSGDGHVCIEIQDNGIGIAAESITAIFAHGFTTRQDGHGFGLHSAALAAQEMGAELTASSDGPGKGATFTLELPMATSDSRQEFAETV